MTNTQHTPGPWKVANNGKRGQESETFRIWRNDLDNNEEENRGYACISPHVHKKANAMLIAAAPDLLEALEKMLKIHYGKPGQKRTATEILGRNAIAKARGQV